MGVEQRAEPRPAERDRHRVDREVAPRQVLGDARRADLGQGAGALVGLAAGPGDVDLVLAEPGLGGREALVLDHLPAEPLGDLGGVSLDDEVEVVAAAAQQQVAHRPADQEDRRLPGGRDDLAPAPGIAAAQRRRARSVSLRTRFGMGLVPYHDPFPGWPTPRNPRAADPLPAASPQLRPRWWHDRRKLWAAIGGGVVLVAAVAFAAYQILKRARRRQPRRRGPVQAGEAPRRSCKTTNWPMFGFDRARTRWLPANRVKPPFKELWKHGGKPLIEFPPIFVKARGPVREADQARLRRAALLRRQQRLRLLARRRHRQGHLAAADRRAERLLAGLLAGQAVHRQPRPRADPQPRRRDRQDDLEALAAGALGVLAGGGRAAASSSADEDGEPARLLDPQRPHHLDARRWPARSRPAPPTTTASSTSATTAARCRR